MAVKEKAAATFTNTVTMESTLDVTGASTFTGAMVGNGGLTVYNTTNLKGRLVSSYTDFLSGYAGNLTASGATISDAHCDSAAASAGASTILATTLTADAVSTVAFDGGAAGSVYLPVCAANTLVVLSLIGDIDETNALTIFARGAAGEADAAFAKGVIRPQRQGATAEHQLVTAGTVASPTTIKLIYTAAAADTNFLGIGSQIFFYAPVANQWLVKVFNVPEGSGATGAFTGATS